MAAPVGAVARPAEDHVEKTKALIGALSLISRNLLIPPEEFDAVSSIYHDGEEEVYDTEDVAEAFESNDAPAGKHSISEVLTSRALISQLEDALLKQLLSRLSASALEELKEGHFQSHIQHRLEELEVLPSSRGEDLKQKCLLELYGLKLVELQRKVRSDVCAEYWLHEKCAYPDGQLFDWGIPRFRHPFSMYGIGDAFAMEGDERQHKKRDAEKLSRLEEEERNRVKTRKRKFLMLFVNFNYKHKLC